MALSGHAVPMLSMSVLGVKRTFDPRVESAFDPKRTSRMGQKCPADCVPRDQGALSNAKMRFQSFFMLMTVQPPFFASS